MKNNVSKVLIGIALMFAAGGAYSEPIDHTFSTNDPIFIDPLLTGLTSVSGSFTYENAVAPEGTITEEEFPEFAGSTFYTALSNLTGEANGNSFSDPLGFVTVGDDKFSVGPPPTDVVDLAWGQAFGTNLSGFSFAGLTLESVNISWFEGSPGIGDFLEDQSLPSVLPPTLSGALTLVFVDGVGGQHAARFGVTVVPIIPANSDIDFNGQLAVVLIDTGGGVYSGVPIGTNFFGAINRLTSDGFISDGTTRTSFSSVGANRGLTVENDLILDVETAAALNTLSDAGFVEGDIVDLIGIEGDTTAEGGLLFVGLEYVLDPLAFDNESRNNFLPDPDDVLLTFFFIGEEDDDQGVDIYEALGVVDSDGDGIQDAIDGTLNGVFNNQSAVFSDDFTDQHLGGFTFGSIVSRSDNLITVADNPARGVNLTAIGGAGTTQVQTCANPGVEILLTDGDEIIVTCGSFTGETLAGPVTVNIGMNIGVTIPAGAIAFIEELPDSNVSISNLGETGSPEIVIDDNGNITNLGPDDSPFMTIPDVDDDESGQAAPPAGSAPLQTSDDNWFGCSVGSGDGPVDPTLPLLLLISLLYLTRRRWMRA